jgi:photosystem II stability/assembly factor-like uncharacterized protein
MYRVEYRAMPRTLRYQSSRRLRCFIALTLLMSSSTILAELDGRFTALNRVPCSGNIFDGYCFTPQRGVLITDKGMIIRTDDGGAHWRSSTDCALRGVVSVAGVDSACAFAVNKNGKTVRTVDGGRRWQQLRTGIEEWRSIRKAYAHPFANDWFILGDRGYAIRSRDAGETWNSVPTGSSEKLYDIVFLNSLSGCIIADKQILYTSNGGRSWTVRNYPEIEGDRIAAFYQVKNGRTFAMGENGSIFIIEDNCLKWKRVNRTDSVEFCRMAFFTPSVGAVAGMMPSLSKKCRYMIYRTKDGGSTWKRQTVIEDTAFRSWVTTFRELNGDMMAIKDAISFRTLFCNGKTYALLAGNRGAIAETFDQGERWVMPDLRVNSDFLGISIPDSGRWGRWFVYGTNACILYSTDQGRAWSRSEVTVHEREVDASKAIERMVWASDSIGFCKIRQNKMLMTRDAGRTWSPYGSTAGLSGFKSSVAILLDFDGSITVRQKSGYGWHSGRAPWTRALHDLAVRTDNECIAVGDSGYVAVSRDRGKTWSVSQRFTNKNLITIVFADSMTGYIYSSPGGLFRTSDGGNSWSELEHRSIGKFNRMAFWNAGEGVAFPDRFTIDPFRMMVTRNGGETWFPYEVPGDVRFYGGVFLNNGKGILVGENATVMTWNHPNY